MSTFKIHVLGFGGAFDFEEGHSAFYIQVGNNTPFLLDCGSTVLPKLKKLLNNDSGRFIKENTVIVTHTHEDHVGSLSGNVYMRYFAAMIRGESASTRILCQKNVADKVKNKLIINNNHEVNQFSIGHGGVYKDLGVSIAFIDTTGYHFKGFPTSGVIMRDIDGSYLVVSGDVNVPIFDLIKVQYPKIWNEMDLNPEKVLILHDVTTWEYPNNPHCFYKLLDDYKEKFPYIWPYHHDKGQMEALNQSGWVNLLGDKLDANLFWEP